MNLKPKQGGLPRNYHKYLKWYISTDFRGPRSWVGLARGRYIQQLMDTFLVFFLLAAGRQGSRGLPSLLLVPRATWHVASVYLSALEPELLVPCGLF